VRTTKKAELSYAYLHAVAASAGFACSTAHRHLDGCGVDARVDIKEQLTPDSLLTDFTLDVQLKATSSELTTVADRHSFAIDVSLYNRLRSATVAIPRFLVLFHMPADPGEWLNVSGNELVSRRCALWISLLGAPDAQTTTTTTVRFPIGNILTPAALRAIATTVSLGEALTFDE
jgi:hypothetical protein